MFWKKFQNWNSVFGKLFQFGILILEKNSNSGIFLGFFSKFQLVIYIWNFPNLEIRNFVPHFTNIGKFHCAVERTNPLLSCYCCPMCLQCVSSVSSDTLVVEYFLQGLQGFLPTYLQERQGCRWVPLDQSNISLISIAFVIVLTFIKIIL